METRPEDLAESHAKQFALTVVWELVSREDAFDNAIRLRDSLYFITKNMTDEEADLFVDAYDWAFTAAADKFIKLQQSIKFDSADSRPFDPEEAQRLARMHAAELVAVAKQDRVIGKPTAHKLVKELEERVIQHAEQLRFSDNATFFASYKEFLLSELDCQATEAESAPPSVRYNRAGTRPPRTLGQQALETAVRATVWESVRGVFRLFR